MMIQWDGCCKIKLKIIPVFCHRMTDITDMTIYICLKKNILIHHHRVINGCFLFIDQMLGYEKIA